MLTLAYLCKDDSDNTSLLSGLSNNLLVPLTLHETENMRLKQDIQSYKREVQQLQRNLATLDGREAED